MTMGSFLLVAEGIRNWELIYRGLAVNPAQNLFNEMARQMAHQRASQVELRLL